jgi:hypothetical protein
MAEYPSAHRILAELAGTWTDLTSWVIDDITGSWGIQGNGPLDLVANAGQMRFTLNNMDQRFTPGHASVLAGWQKGIRIKLEIDYDGETYAHLGKISEINVPLDDDQFDRAYVLVSDWIEESTKTPVVNPGVLANQRGSQVIETLMDMIPFDPEAIQLDRGESVFPTTFDTVTSTTKAYTELSKVAISEPGYVYLKKDKVHGETLVFEDSASRHGWRTLSPLPIVASRSGYLLKEDGGKLLKEDGGGILLNQTEELVVDNEMLDIESVYGQHVINYFTLIANPRRKDASPQVLFQLDEAILIASGQTVTIKGTYADPAGGFPINANPSDMVTPVATTDYLANTSEDGTGTDFTASLALTDIAWGSEGFTHQVRNDSAYAGWIIKYNTRGLGIYQYNPIEHVAKDDPSIQVNGHYTETLDQKYQSSLGQGRVYVEAAVEDEKDPRIVINKVTFLANQSSTLMMAFLNFGPGSLVRIKHTKRGVDSYFYIQGVSEFRVTSGGLIMFTWVVKQVLTMTLGLSMLAVEFNGAGTTGMVDYGYLPRVYSDNTPEQVTFTAWLRTDDGGSIVGFVSNAGGIRFALARPGGVPSLIAYTNIFRDYPGEWWTSGLTLNTGTLYHVAMTYDYSSLANDPIIYVNGVAQTITEVKTPLGTKYPRDNSPLQIGNRKTATENLNFPFDGKLYDVRVYQRILSASELVTLYNAGTPDKSLLTDGLAFQAFTVPTYKLSTYIDATLDSSKMLREAVSGAIGTPMNGVIGRSAP